jgi:hypothetical protein
MLEENCNQNQDLFAKAAKESFLMMWENSGYSALYVRTGAMKNVQGREG